jgi:hypothetical protein
VIALGFQNAVGQNFGWLKERAKTEKEERKNEFVNLFFRENWVESAWKYFLWKVSKKFFETNLEKISDAVVFPVMKHKYEMRVRWIYWRLLDVEGKNNLLKIEMKRKGNLFDFWKDFFFLENVFVEIDLNLKEKEFHWISKDSQLI